MTVKELYPQDQLAADEADMVKSGLEAEGMPDALGLQPFLLRASGLYRWNSILPLASQSASVTTFAAEAESAEAQVEGPPEAALPILFSREELRLDVDGVYPQMTASGALYNSFALQVHWIAKLTATGPNSWLGTIWYKYGGAAILPYTKVKITVIRSLFPNLRKATVTFTGGGTLPRTRIYRFASAYFHPVEFEYDHEVGVAPDLEVNTCAHPNRPASLPCQVLPIETVFRRAGFDAKRNSAGTTPIPNDGPDPNSTWSDAEMHDAMQAYWSHFANKPQWQLWVLFAKQHDFGTGLGGIMFDDIGPNHRQGTAIFYNSFISTAPGGDPAPGPYVTRMHFWTAVHEMGHAFNLAHSWQKNLGIPWIALPPDPEARSFMNYPYFVTGGEAAFFANFEYRFTDQELLFMRHAPEKFVEMGYADWFDHHGFRGADTAPTAGLELEIGVNRQRPDFEFLEPVVLELKVTNVSSEPRIVPSEILNDTTRMTVILKKDGKPARQWSPYATHCSKSSAKVLQPGQEMTASLFASAGVNGWDLAEPGRYKVQMSLQVDGGDLVSNLLNLRVAPPRSHEEEHIAQDVFTDAAGRAMAFDGTLAPELESGVNAWREVVVQLPESKAATHARITLAMPRTRNYRQLRIDAPMEALALDGNGAFAVSKAKPDEARKQLEGALLGDAEVAAATLGHVDYEYYCEKFTKWLKKSGAEKEAKRVDEAVRKVVAKAAEHYPKQKGRVTPKAAAE